MLRLEKLHLKNFITYEDQVVNFNKFFVDSNILLIYGKNLDDISFASDNGAGKSILYQAILFALTGRTTRGTSPDLLVGKFAKSMSCSLNIIDSDSNKIWIKRYRKNANFGNELRLKVNGKEIKKGKSREMTGYLLNLLTISYRRIINTSIFESDDERSRFIYLNDKDGKALLSQIKGLEIFQKCFEIAKERTVHIENEINKTETSINMITNNLEQSKQFLEQTRKSYEKADLQIRREIEEIQQQRIKEKKELSKTSKLFRDEIYATSRQIKRIKKTLIPIKDMTKTKFKLDLTIDNLTRFSEEIVRSNIAIGNSEKNLKLLRNNKSKIGRKCDFCGSTIKGAHLKKHIASVNNFIIFEKSNVRRFEEQNAKHQKQYDKFVAKIFKNDTNIKENETKKQKIKTFSNRIKECVQLLTMASKNYARMVNVLESRSMIISERKNQYAKMMSEIKEKITNQEQNLSNLVKDQKVLNKKYRYNYAWFLGYGKEGLQTSALKATVRELNNEIDRVSEILTDGTIDINLVTEKVLRNKRVKNLFEFEISDNNKKNLPFKEWSKGQKKRIEIIVSFALMSIEDSVISEVFLDELFDGIDEVGINKIKTLLDNEAQIKDRRFVIFSHSKEIKDLFTNRAYVKLENGKSTLHKELI